MGDLADEGRQGKALRRLSRLKLLVPFRVAHPACNFRCLPSHAAGRESNRLREATCFNFSPQRGMRKCGELQYLGFAKVPLDLDSHHMHPASQESKTAARGSAFPATTTNKAMAAMIPRAVSALRIARPSLSRRCLVLERFDDGLRHVRLCLLDENLANVGVFLDVPAGVVP